MRNAKPLVTTSLSALALTMVVMASSLLACGGNDQPTIKHRLDMSTLAQTPPSDRTAVAVAYQKHYEAELELAHTEFALKDSKYALQIARTKREQSKQDQKIARLESKRGEAAFMTTLATAATKLVNASKLQAQSATLEIRYLKAQRKYLAKHLRYTEAQLLATEASLELAKAKLSKERGTLPKTAKFEKFVSQEKSFKERASKRQQNSRSALAKAQAQEKAWKNASK